MSTLEPGTKLPVNQPVLSQAGFTKLIFQTDGNLVLYCQRSSGWVPRWASNTSKKSVDLCMMQKDGKLVLYRGKTPIWSSGKKQHPGARLVVQRDENVVIYQGKVPVWATNTALDDLTIKGAGPRVYHLSKGVRHWVPDPETLEQRFGGLARVATLTNDQVNQWPEGDPVPSVRPAPVEQFELCHDKQASGPPLLPRQTPPLPPHIQPDGSVVGVITQPLAGVTEKMWDAGQTVRVAMLGGTPFVRSRVQHYANAWTRHANIHFEFVDLPQLAQIRISFEPSGDSWSNLGRDALWIPPPFPTMNFGGFTDGTPEVKFSRTVTHEFGHALGLIHEHQSPASGIQWDREKVYAYFKRTYGWDPAEVDVQVFEKYSVPSTNYSQFDPHSIMLYPIPPEVTLDGHGVVGGTELSATDQRYIAMWYPHPPSPQNSTGLLRTGDDCDEIDFSAEYGVTSPDVVDFRLAPGTKVRWWKAIEVPIGGSGYRMFEMQDGRSDGGAIPLAEIDAHRPIRFWKAKTFGIHTRLSYTWDVLGALPGGSRLSLLWKRDHC